MSFVSNGLNQTMTEHFRLVTREMLLQYCSGEAKSIEIENGIYAYSLRESQKRNVEFEDLYYRKVESTVGILLSARRLEL